LDVFSRWDGMFVSAQYNTLHVPDSEPGHRVSDAGDGGKAHGGSSRASHRFVTTLQQ
jgi:hypothetical protein